MPPGAFRSYCLPTSILRPSKAWNCSAQSRVLHSRFNGYESSRSRDHRCTREHVLVYTHVAFLLDRPDESSSVCRTASSSTLCRFSAASLPARPVGKPPPPVDTSGARKTIAKVVLRIKLHQQFGQKIDVSTVSIEASCVACVLVRVLSTCSTPIESGTVAPASCNATFRFLLLFPTSYQIEIWEGSLLFYFAMRISILPVQPAAFYFSMSMAVIRNRPLCE